MPLSDVTDPPLHRRNHRRTTDEREGRAMDCPQLSPGGGLACQRPDRHESGHVWVAEWSPDGHHDDEAVDW
jgi:hypothetical protein